MKFKSHIISQGSGKVAGLVYSANRFGNYTRNWRRPVNTPTDARTEIRGLFTGLVTFWTTGLTPAQRSAWEVYGTNTPTTDRLGQTIHLTGQNWFIGCNTARMQMGLDQINEAPVIFDRGTYSPPSFIPDVGAQEVNVYFNETDAWVSTDGAAMGIYVARPINGNRTFFKGPYLFAGVIEGNSATPPTSPVTIPVPFPIAPDQALGCRATVTQVDGRYGTGTYRLPITQGTVSAFTFSAGDFVTDGTDGLVDLTASIGAAAGAIDAAGNGSMMPTVAEYTLDGGTTWSPFTQYLGQIVATKIRLGAQVSGTPVDLSGMDGFRILNGPPFIGGSAGGTFYQLTQPQGDAGFPFP